MKMASDGMTGEECVESILNTAVEQAPNLPGDSFAQGWYRGVVMCLESILSADERPADLVLDEALTQQVILGAPVQDKCPCGIPWDICAGMACLAG